MGKQKEKNPKISAEFAGEERIWKSATKPANP